MHRKSLEENIQLYHQVLANESLLQEQREMTWARIDAARDDLLRRIEEFNAEAALTGEEPITRLPRMRPQVNRQ